MNLALEQTLNGIQFGVMLFLLAAGLTLIFGVMRIINLAHGAFYMIGAYGAALVGERTGSYALAALAGLAAAGLAGLIIEFVVIRRLYARDHVQQVLATFGVILLINEGTTILFGRQPLYLPMPAVLSGTVQIVPGVPYPAYRLAIIVAGLLVAIGLSLFINRTRIGMLVRAGSTHREMVRALGVNIRATLHAGVRPGRAARRLRRPVGRSPARGSGRNGRADSDPDVCCRRHRRRRLDPRGVCRSYAGRHYGYSIARVPADAAAPGDDDFGGGCFGRRAFLHGHLSAHGSGASDPPARINSCSG